MMKIGIFDYGLGNLRSVERGFHRLGINAEIISSSLGLERVDAIVLPGVGAFRDAIGNLREVSESLLDQMDSGKPLLGICLGLQVLFESSTEGGFFKGLGYFCGDVIRLPEDVTTPHMGWNTLHMIQPDHPLMKDVPEGSYMYFAHSYYPVVSDERVVVASTDYGMSFPAVVSKGSAFATQFHPEKSGGLGIRILSNFVKTVRR